MYRLVYNMLNNSADTEDAVSTAIKAILEGRTMNLNDKKDEIIRRKMREPAAGIPESFHAHIKTLMRELPAGPKAERRNISDGYWYNRVKF